MIFYADRPVRSCARCGEAHYSAIGLAACLYQWRTLGYTLPNGSFELVAL